jgi:myo-inositol-1(or 4)-monophosphatase
MGTADQADLLRIGQTAADAAAIELRARFGELAVGVRAKSSPTDLVSDADLAAEAAIRAVITRSRPEDAVIGEEGGETGEGELRWIVDPLDGTTNFLCGIPTFAVSIACEDETGTLAGIVLDPLREECFTATREGEAMMNGHSISSSARKQLDTALVATGFGYDAAQRARQAEVVARILPRARDIRRAGAAALDLCWSACGRYDAYYERGLHAWDLAAGAQIARRAGLSVRELTADGEEPAGILVAPEAFIAELYALVARRGA